MTDVDRLVRMLRAQAQHCAQSRSPLYAGLLVRAADDAASGGPVRAALADHDRAPGEAAVPLRLMGGVHRLVLERRAPALALHYPSVGGRPGEPDEVWTAFRGVVEEHVDEVRAALGTPPQTNEVGRSAALLGGLLHVAARYRLPVRLHEVGTSAGLNLRADRFAYESGGALAWGPADSPVRLVDAWRGPLPPTSARVELVERRGTDLAPLDPATTEGRVLLTSYVWADQVERLERLRAAFEVAAGVPAQVQRAGAGEAVGALGLTDGALTVLWHSVMWQYVDRAERAHVQAAIARLGASASRRAPFAHLRMEPEQTARGLEFQVLLDSWPGPGGTRLLGTAAPHGPPVRWRAVG